VGGGAGGGGVSGHALFSCLQHQSFFSGVQPAFQLAKPALQSSGGHVVTGGGGGVVGGKVVGGGVAGGHPRRVCAQHQVLLGADHFSVRQW